MQSERNDLKELKAGQEAVNRQVSSCALLASRSQQPVPTENFGGGTLMREATKKGIDDNVSASLPRRPWRKVLGSGFRRSGIDREERIGIVTGPEWPKGTVHESPLAGMSAVEPAPDDQAAVHKGRPQDDLAASGSDLNIQLNSGTHVIASDDQEIETAARDACFDVRKSLPAQLATVAYPPGSSSQYVAAAGQIWSKKLEKEEAKLARREAARRARTKAGDSTTEPI